MDLASWAARLQALAVKDGRTVGTAESCTGGLIGHALTAIAGSSDYYLGGVISYSNELKMRLLGVPAEVLERHGAVRDALPERNAQVLHAARHVAQCLSTVKFAADGRCGGQGFGQQGLALWHGETM